MSEEPSAREIFALLDSEYARAILAQTSIEPMSTRTLNDQCDASLPTIYRRTERLVDYDLLAEQTEIGESDRHYSVFEARLDSLTVEVDEGDISVSLDADRAEDPADRFTDLWEGVRDGST